MRAYLDTPVKKQDIQKLLEYAMAAPSALDRRPWKFYVITDKAKLQELNATSRFTNFTSPLVIIVAGDKSKMLRQPYTDFWMQDCSAAVQNILLGATSLGLGSCWCGVYPKQESVEKVREVLGEDENIIPFALVRIGYATEMPEPRNRFMPENVTYIE